MSEPFLGQIMTVGFGFAPRGWSTCEGQLLPISQNSALFSLLGTTFGGDGRTTFGLPDLRGRYERGKGTGPGLSPVNWGQKGGAETHTLSTAQMPSHNHAVAPPVNNAAGNTDNPQNAFPAPQSDDHYNSASTSGATGASYNTGNQGGGQGFGILDPYLGLYIIIALVGLYPSRS